MSNAAKKSAPASITKAEVTSNVDTGKTANLVNGILRMTYYESILQDSVKANVIFGDVGLAVDNKSVIEGLPLIGTEDIKLEFEDNNENKIRVRMNVNKVTPVYEDGSKNVTSLDLVSEEVLRNEMGESRCRTRENGLISDSVEKIFTDRLKSEKKLDIEEQITFEAEQGNWDKVTELDKEIDEIDIKLDALRRGESSSKTSGLKPVTKNTIEGRISRSEQNKAGKDADAVASETTYESGEWNSVIIPLPSGGGGSPMMTTGKRKRGSGVVKTVVIDDTELALYGGK